MLLVFYGIQTAAGGIHVAAVIIATFGLDVSRQNLQVSLSTAVFNIKPAARAQLNAVSIISIFVGQVMGTAGGTHVFVNFGWRAGAALSLGRTGLQLVILLLRGPHCKRYTWFGYEGGFEARRKKVSSLEQKPANSESPSESNTPPENSPEVDQHSPS
ncbi:hypothetical protein AN958_04055 [Leucoagaricus sp. SymC.cos]|nr:hypothetical protein AN958_04055 [Leucoagaricus sp. SymC.cos]